MEIPCVRLFLLSAISSISDEIENRYGQIAETASGLKHPLPLLAPFPRWAGWVGGIKR